MTELAKWIDHVVIIVKENHTFDNYFGTFLGANGVQLKPAKIRLDTTQTMRDASEGFKAAVKSEDMTGIQGQHQEGA